MSVTGRQVRCVGALLGATGMVVLLGGPAAAEVSVASGDATAGTTSFVGLAVSTDRPDAGTNRVEVRLPADRTFTSVAAGAKPGWDVSVTGAAVTWTAQTEADAIRPGNFEMFSLKLGPIPSDTSSIALSAVQTYTDGQSVTAATLSVPIRSANAGIAAASTSETSSGASSDDTAASTETEEEEDNAARVATGLAVGGLFILLGVIVAAAVNRKPPPESV